MRSFKKVVFIILALLPLLSLFVNCLQMHSVESVEYIPLGTVDIIDGSYVIEENSWADRILTPLGITSSDKGFWHATTSFVSILDNDVGIPCSFPIVLVAWYAMYEFIIMFIFLITDFLTLIPRLCKDFFKVGN